MTIPLEDNFNDIIGKAMRGLKISDSQVAEQTGIAALEVKRLREGEFNEVAARKIAPLLHLGADALVEAGRKSWHPFPVELEQLALFNTPFDDVTVNSYLVWEAHSREAVAFDTGSDCTGMLDLLKSKGLKLKAIFLTHTHGDHIFDLDRLMEETGAMAYVGELEPLDGAHPVVEGSRFRFGALDIEALLTWGHSPGGITYVVNGLSLPVAIVGDSIFAGSIGGGTVSYEEALKNNREKILTLNDSTVICPGHGPMTTIAEEKLHNAFFTGHL
ncbi:MAG: Beta-lactamase domain protein [Chthoniobacteraceae bacterium]|nr:Beta-lactamase domain protein [Chthoniobacteraceae bacterium]